MSWGGLRSWIAYADEVWEIGCEGRSLIPLTRRCYASERAWRLGLERWSRTRIGSMGWVESPTRLEFRVFPHGHQSLPIETCLEVGLEALTAYACRLDGLGGVADDVRIRETLIPPLERWLVQGV